MQSEIEAINNSVDINQKRVPLEDPKDMDTQALTIILIYCGFYYPTTSDLLLKVVNKVLGSFPNVLQASINHIYRCLEREIIVGPSSSHFPPGEIPHLSRQDNSFIIQEEQHQNKENFFISIANLGLTEYFSKEDVEQLIWYNCSGFLSMKNVQQSRIGYKLFQGELQIDGQSWLQTTPFPSIFCSLAFILEKILEHKLEKQLQVNLRLLWARLSFLHNRNLKNPVKCLKQRVLNNYKIVFQLKGKDLTKQDYVQLLLQYSFCLLFYYKYSQAEQMLRYCSKILHMQIQFTGKLGRRTKFQVFDTPQLVMNITQQKQEDLNEQIEYSQQQLQESKNMNFIDAKQLVARQRGLTGGQTDKINVSSYDQQNILLETPKFIQQQKQQTAVKQINQHHLLTTLTILYFKWRSVPHDQMLFQNISTSIMTLQKYNIPTSFSYNFSLLLLRSLNEFPRLKNVERALDQLEKLRTVFNNKTGKNIYNLYSTPYQTNLSYVLVLAGKYMEIGLSLTAIQLFEQVGLLQECVDVLIEKRFKQRAAEMLQKVIQSKGTNPRILCMLGDLHKDIKYYYQAWEMSKQRNARSMRALGWHYFNLGEFPKATQCFHNATTANYYHPNTWFTLGCCYMRSKQFEKALRAFSQSVSIDDTQGEAWGNMASCYMHLKKMKEAFSTLEQAVKHAQSNWRLWGNIITVSLLVKRFYKYFEAIEKVVGLNHQQVLNQQIFKKIVQVMRYQNNSTDRKRSIFNYRNRIDKLFLFLQKNIGENPLVWRGRSQYEVSVLQYIEDMKKHYLQLHKQNKIDINDIVPGYQTVEAVQSTTKIDFWTTRAKIVQYKQFELNMHMKVGWNQNKIQGEKVKTALQEYVEVYRIYSTKADKADFKLFLNGICQKISACLQQNFSIATNWLE